MKDRRYLAVYLPLLATDRIRAHEPELAGKPLATWALQGNRRLLVCVDAPGTTLAPGQALADAQAMYPEINLRPADAEADLAFLERLALWCLRYTPLAANNPPDGLLLDSTGCTDLFGGEEDFVAGVLAPLRRGGMTVRAVLASIPDAAAALARAGRDSLILQPGQDQAAIAHLPLSVLRLDCAPALYRLGLQRVDDLLNQPRAPLTRRFGRELLDMLDGLRGERLRPMRLIRPPPEFIEAGDFIEPVVTRPGIERALDILLDGLCRTLADAGRGARTLTLRAYRVDRDIQEVTIGTGLPSRTPAHLRRLFAEKLGTFEPDLGFERMTLQADTTNELFGDQDDMNADSGDPRQNEEALGQLLDRLSQRLKVWRLAPVESHWPERAVTRADPFQAVSAPHPSDLPMPVRLLRRPVPVAVLPADDRHPLRMRLRGKVYRVNWCDGPERIEPEWWREPATRPGRDYYRVELESGERLWIGRLHGNQPDEASRWFLHGHLP